MDASMNLITAQISFLEGRFVLIHIPLQYYPFFLQPIQRLLFGEDHDEDAYKIPWPYRHSFLNVSITPVECSVVCARGLADRYFQPLVDRFNHLASSRGSNEHVQISPEDFDVIQVDGQGLDAGQRVLEITSPLALAGIPIFFETTYFSDYILVPHKSIRTVTKTLEQRGFTFSPSAAAYVSELSPSSPITPRQSLHPGSSGNPFDFTSSSSSTNLPTIPPSTPPASNINQLQTRTFAKLKRAGIVPTVDRSIRLVSCAGRKETNPSFDNRLRLDLLQILLATCPDGTPQHQHDADTEIPDFSTRFLSLTLTYDEPISLLLESHLLSTPSLRLSSTLLFSHSPAPVPSLSNAPTGFNEGGEGKDVLIPIVLDLRDLPPEATGIVCGVAGRLAQGTTAQQGSPSGYDDDDDDDEGGDGGGGGGGGVSPRDKGEATVAEAVEISFLSTARAGTVIVRERELDRAVRALEVSTEAVNVDV